MTVREKYANAPLDFSWELSITQHVWKKVKM